MPHLTPRCGRSEISEETLRWVYNDSMGYRRCRAVDYTKGTEMCIYRSERLSRLFRTSCRFLALLLILIACLLSTSRDVHGQDTTGPVYVVQIRNEIDLGLLVGPH